MNAPATRRPRVVATIHGIQTRGVWQKNITPHLAKHGLIPYHLDFGWFDAIRFFFAPTRKAQVQRMRKELRNLVYVTGVRRVSVIAHSFGTLIAMEALMAENGDLLYDRIVLSGSIVPVAFPWRSILGKEKRWAMAVRNERTDSDRVVSLAGFVSRRLGWLSRLKAGPSGREPFSETSVHLIDSFIEGGHSETHNETKFERWARFLSYPVLPRDILEKVRTELQAFRLEAALLLELEASLVRVNLFAPIDGALRIVPGATDNMTYAPEFDLRIEPDHGATGTAYSRGASTIVLSDGANWSGNTLPSDELAKIHPDLRWVVALPMRSVERDAVVGVVNVDGLKKVPPLLQNAESVDCQAAMLALHGGVLKRLAPVLESAFRGEQLQPVEV